MRILIVSDTYSPRKDGIAVFTTNLAERLARKGEDVHVWTPGLKRIKSYVEVKNNVTMHREKSLNFFLIPNSRVGYWPFFAAEKVIESVKPDIVHVQSPFFMGMAAAVTSKRLGVPTLLTYHIMPENIIMNTVPPTLYDYSQELVWDYLMWCYNRADYLTAPTKSALNLLTEHGYNIPSQVISNGVDIKKFSPGNKDLAVLAKHNIPANKKLAVYVGRIDREKRVDILIKAFGKLTNKNDYHLVVCGRGKYFKSIQKMITDEQLNKRVTLTGFVRDSDKIAILRTSDLFVIASPAELQSIATLEAMACGLPVVAVDKVALRELCHDDINGYLFTENDFKQLAEKIDQILGQPTKQAKFSAASRDIITKHHDITKTIQSYQKLYHQLIQKESAHHQVRSIKSL